MERLQVTGIKKNGGLLTQPLLTKIKKRTDGSQHAG
jgi:hypothetical protein